MIRGHLVCVAACMALLTGGIGLAAETRGDALKSAGLSRSGNLYVLGDEAAVLDGFKALKQTKVQADKETRARHALEMQIASKRKVAKDADKEWHTLETRLTLVQDVGIHNRIVMRMNRLVADYKESLAAAKDLEEQAGKSSTTAKTQFVDDLSSLNGKAEAAAEKYKRLAEDPGVKAAIAKVNAAANTRVALGPSPEFTAAASELHKWQSAVESEAIPLREEHGIHMVDVLLNGEHFVMGLDTGASSLSLPAEVAQKLKMVPGEKDPTVQLQLADGNVIEGKEMSVKSVRVGRFTVEDVSCVVLDKGLTDAPLILGGSFLNRFIVKVDPSTNELHLTRIEDQGATTAAHAGRGAARIGGQNRPISGAGASDNQDK